MDNTNLMNSVASELAIRLANAEIDRASFKAQVQQLAEENKQLKEQLDKLKNKQKSRTDKQ